MGRTVLEAMMGAGAMIVRGHNVGALMGAMMLRKDVRVTMGL